MATRGKGQGPEVRFSTCEGDDSFSRLRRAAMTEAEGMRRHGGSAGSLEEKA